VAGVFGSINYGARPVGAVIGGLLGSAIGVRPTLVVAAVGGVMACLWLLRSPIPALRTLPDGDEVALVA
jgi:predicted MFS family arabinose efflux permease